MIVLGEIVAALFELVAEVASACSCHGAAATNERTSNNIYARDAEPARLARVQPFAAASASCWRIFRTSRSISRQVSHST